MSDINLDEYEFTPLLRQALEEVLKLPENEQERIGQRLLGHLQAEEPETRDKLRQEGEGNKD